MTAIQFKNEMDVYAQMQFAEFGYDTCDDGQKLDIIKAILKNDL
tara:strand:+ start:311 stop:442 length:132 start_codon:yes stop_codon:yes gene_type:complete